MTKSLRLAKDLTLPLDAVSRTFGILAVRGAGKSNTAAVMAEEMFAAGLPFVVIDPVGSWYGLRSSADGKSAGLPIPIFGGKHGDVPLERGAGEMLADLTVEKRLTCVLDLSRFDSENAKKTFLLAFAQRLYQKNENPLHLFLEEADDYIPQKPMRDEAQLLRAWENIVRRGRSRGLGMTLITQRSAAVAKMVLTQVETLFAMRTTGPQDIAAIEAWIKYHQADKDILSTLAGLEDGEAWVWSPHYLKTMSRHQIRRRHTFDSGASPKNLHAKETQKPATLADIDLSAIQSQMAATIEKAKADDPRELRRQIAELKKQTSKAAPVTDRSSLSKKDLEKLGDIKRLRRQLELAMKFLVRVKTLNFDGRHSKALEEAITEALTKVTAAHEARIARVADAIERLKQDAERSSAEIAQLIGKDIDVTVEIERRPPVPSKPAQTVTRVSGRQAPSRKPSEGSDASIGKGERIVLTAVAQHPAGVTREQLTVLTGYARSSRDTYLQRLNQAGLVTNGHGRIIATDTGVAALGDFEPLPTGDALWQHWRRELPEGERRILEILVAAYPKTVDRVALDEATGYARSSRDTYLQRLGARRLVDTERGSVRASQELFD